MREDGQGLILECGESAPPQEGNDMEASVVTGCWGDVGAQRDRP